MLEGRDRVHPERPSIQRPIVQARVAAESRLREHPRELAPEEQPRRLTKFVEIGLPRAPLALRRVRTSFTGDLIQVRDRDEQWGPVGVWTRREPRQQRPEGADGNFGQPRTIDHDHAGRCLRETRNRLLLLEIVSDAEPRQIDELDTSSKARRGPAQLDVGHERLEESSSVELEFMTQLRKVRSGLDDRPL